MAKNGGLNLGEEFKNEKEICGIIMPISEINGCSKQHWLDVKEIISSAIKNAGYSPNLVSNTDEVGLIQSTIIQNIYDNPIVICDVSCHNPNVMFELGLRLAFDKPTIIIADDLTKFNFDTSPIEHLQYPRDLRHTTIIKFIDDLSKKITATIRKKSEDPNYSPFIKHFGQFKIAQIETKEVSQSEYIIEAIRDLQNTIYVINKNSNSFLKNNDTREICENDDFVINLFIKEFINRKIDRTNMTNFITLKYIIIESVKKENNIEYFLSQEQIEILYERAVNQHVTPFF